ncbi:MAG: hypothetical protein Kow0069_16160 [Promethearchaeota archaeon]
MLKRLRLESWKCFDSLDVEFKPGLNLVHGRNHAGKTSVSHALHLALTGASPISKQKGVTETDALAMLKRLGEEKASVALDLDVSKGTGTAGQVFRVKRFVFGRRRRPDSSIWSVGASGEDERELAVGDETDEKLRTLLGLSDAFVRQALFLREEDVFEAVARPDEAFVKELDAFASVGPLPSWSAAATTLAKKRKKEARDLKSEVARVKRELESKKRELASAAGAGDADAAELDAEERRAALEREVDALERKLEECDESLTSAEEEVARLVAACEKVDKMGKLAMEREAYAREKEEVELGAGTSGEPLPEALRNAKDERNQQDEALREIRELLAINQTLAETERDRLEKLSSAGGTCPLCEQPLSPEHLREVTSKLRARIEELQVERGDLEEQAADVESEIARLKDRVAVLKQGAKRLGLIEDELDRLRNEYADILNEGSASKALQELGVELPAWGDASVGALKEALGKVARERDRAVKERDELRRTRHRVEKELITAKVNLQILASVKASTGRRDLIKHLSDKLKDLEARRKAAVHSSYLLEVFSAALNETLEEMRKSTTQRVKNQVSDAWRKFHGGAAAFDWNEKFIPLVTEGGQELSALQMSEAERLETFVSLRVTLASSFGEAKFIVLDEPFHHLDPDNQRLLWDYLRGAVDEGRLHQVVVTSFQPHVRDDFHWDHVVELGKN